MILKKKECFEEMFEENAEENFRNSDRHKRDIVSGIMNKSPLFYQISKKRRQLLGIALIFSVQRRHNEVRCCRLTGPL